MLKLGQRRLVQALEQLCQPSCRQSLWQRNYAQEASGGPIYSTSCLLERLPVVVPDDEPWEKEWDEWHDQLWNKWRKVTPPELYRQKYTAESFTGNDEDEDWEPAPRITEADNQNDTRSLERKLDRRLFLIVNHQDKSGGNAWELPRIPLDQEASNIRDEAEKALRHHARGEPSWQIFMVGECPCGHWQSPQGTTFVNKAQLIKGKVALQAGSSYSDYAWLCREEAIERVTDEKLKQLFDQLLPRYL